jgi:hypothetical protein
MNIMINARLTAAGAHLEVLADQPFVRSLLSSAS